MTLADELERIWLSPLCDLDAHHGEGRTWAETPPEAECEDCGSPWVEYVRAAAIQSLTAENALCKQQIGVFTEAFDGLKAERDAALSRAAKMRSLLDAALPMLRLLRSKLSIPDEEDELINEIRALLEGSKP